MRLVKQQRASGGSARTGLDGTTSKGGSTAMMCGQSRTRVARSDGPPDASAEAESGGGGGGGGGGGDDGVWECEVEQCDHGDTCPFRQIIEKMDKMERLIDERIEFLDELAAGTYGRR